MKLTLVFLSALMTTACSHINTGQQPNEDILYKYAFSSCLFWYFKNQGYDTEDIRAINGGIVQQSEVSLDKFQEISLYLKDSASPVASKHDINSGLNKCFHLETDTLLKEVISSP